MKNIQLEGRTIEPHYGRNIDKAPALLARWKKGEGYVPSEADVRLLGVRNYKNAPQITNNYWNTSTLSATKGKDVKVILPYDNSGSHELTKAAEFGLALINPGEDLVNYGYGVNLDVDGRWEKLEGNGVYTLQRKGLILNKNLTESQAMKHKLLLTKLGHPDYVEKPFWMYKGEKNKSIDGVQDLIHDTFKLGEDEWSYSIMIGQSLPGKSKKGVMNVWSVCRLFNVAGSCAEASFEDACGRFVFNSVGDTNANAKSKSKIFTDSQDANQGIDADSARVQLKTLEGLLKPEQISEIGSALNERDELRSKLSGLTTDQIYSAIRYYTNPANEFEIKKVLGNLTRQ